MDTVIDIPKKEKQGVTTSQHIKKRTYHSNSAIVPSQSFWKKLSIRINSLQQVKKIISALNEVKEIEAGRREAKSFDDFLAEL